MGVGLGDVPLLPLTLKAQNLAAVVLGVGVRAFLLWLLEAFTGATLMKQRAAGRVLPCRRRCLLILECTHATGEFCTLGLEGGVLPCRRRCLLILGVCTHATGEFCTTGLTLFVDTGCVYTRNR